jgi:glycosyltransferase involved in cell wall biosynthesis
MRIAFVSGMTGAPWGGSEVLWGESARILCARGHSVFASVHGWPTTPKPVQRLAGTGVIVQQRHQQCFDPIVRRVFAACGVRDFGNPKACVISRSFEALKRFRPELVCISHGGTRCALAWMEWCLRQGIPYVSLSQANSEGAWPNDGIAERLLKAHSGAVTSCFVSRGNLSLFEAQVGSRLSNSRVVWNPIQVSSAGALPWPGEEHCLRFACVGRLDPAAKGQDLILEALAQPQWRGRSIRVSFYGSGPMFASLRRYAATLGLSDVVTFEGHVETIESIWLQNHALLLPSRYEGLPLALVEAMHCGRSGVVTDVAGNAEVIVDGETGFLAAAATVGHLSEAMERAWRDRDRLYDMGMGAAKAIRQMMPADPAAEFANLLTECVRKPNRWGGDRSGRVACVADGLDCVVRTRNSAKTLEACLSALHQLPVIKHLIVVDSGSTDETLAIASKFPKVEVVEYPRGAEFNYSTALNLGISAGSRSLVALVSSHVVVGDPSLVDRLVGLMADERCAGAYICPGPEAHQVVRLSDFNGRNGMSNSCGVIRRSDWEMREFREEISACEDQDFAAHWLRRGRHFVRLRSPDLLYLNPYNHPWKRIRDEVVIGQHIYPSIRNFGNYRRKIRNLLGSLRRGKVRDAFWYSVNIVLLGVSGVIKLNPKSSYRSSLVK